MNQASSLTETVTELAKSFTGQLLGAGDPGYEEARKVHNGLIDKRPALIARCRGMADIADAVRLAREHNLEIAVRGGGHNVAGRATIDGGLMIDLSLMKGIHVDPKAAHRPRPGRRHLERVQPRNPAPRPGRRPAASSRRRASPA